MVHSTGVNNPNLRRSVGPDDGLLGVNTNGNHWNQPAPGGRQVCVLAFIGKLADGSIATYQTLPWNYQGWHCGSGSKGSGNNTHIGFEICEDRELYILQQRAGSHCCGQHSIVQFLFFLSKRQFSLLS